MVGVVLSGTRDDGAAGLAFIQAHGGAAVVQDPNEAMYAGMPRSALASAPVAAIVPSARVAETVVAMVNGDDLPPGIDPTDPAPETIAQGTGPQAEAARLQTVCPDCGGVLSEYVDALDSEEGLAS